MAVAPVAGLLLAFITATPDCEVTTLLVRVRSEHPEAEAGALLRAALPAAAEVRPWLAPLGSVTSRARAFGFDRVWRVRMSDHESARAAADTLRHHPAVESVELDACGTVASIDPNDPYFPEQWSLANTGQSYEGGPPGLSGADVDAPAAWDVYTGHAGVTMAIVDTGVSPHADLEGRILEGLALVGDIYDTRDTCTPHGHGTTVAGVAAAAGNNAVGIAGIAWNVQILPVRVFDGCAGNASDAALGMIWAVDQGADVLLVPLHFVIDVELLQDAVDYAAAADVVVVAPAGNSGVDYIGYPAAHEPCIAVSGTTNQDVLWTLSNYGPATDLAAPAEYLWTTATNKDGYFLETGTSYAAAHVGGAAALLRAYAPQLTADDVRVALSAGADDLGAPGRDDTFGEGRLNVAGALSAAPPPTLRFERLDPLPATIPPDSAAQFLVRLVEVDGTLTPGSAHVLFRYSTEEYFFIPLIPAGKDLYVATVPSGACGTVTEYYFSALDQNDAAVVDPVAGAAAPYTAVAQHETDLLYSDFETDDGWTTVVEDPDNTTGAWVRVVPAGTTVQPYYDHSTDEAAYCFVTGQHFGGSPGLTDVDNGPVRLVSPSVTLAAPDARISYAAWFSSASGEADVLTVELSTDGGATWIVAEEISSMEPLAWQERSVRLSEFPQAVGQTLAVRFTTSDLGNDSLTDAAIDDVRVTGIYCFPADGDWDGDGEVDLLDYDRWPACRTGPGTLFTDDHCESFDFDLDGDVDTYDFSRFQQSFAP